jgi:hypothetical protein
MYLPLAYLPIYLPTYYPPIHLLTLAEINQNATTPFMTICDL